MLANLDVSNHGGTGVALSGSNSILLNSSGSGMGCKAANVAGGDTASLVPGNVSVFGCAFARYARFCRTYQAGIAWEGVGNSFVNNTVSCFILLGWFMCGVVSGLAWYILPRLRNRSATHLIPA